MSTEYDMQTYIEAKTVRLVRRGQGEISLQGRPVGGDGPDYALKIARPVSEEELAQLRIENIRRMNSVLGVNYPIAMPCQGIGNLPKPARLRSI